MGQRNLNSSTSVVYFSPLMGEKKKCFVLLMVEEEEEE
jgi:hypothetical protein